MATEPRTCESNSRTNDMKLFGKTTLDAVIAIENIAEKNRASGIISANSAAIQISRGAVAERIYRFRRDADELVTVPGFSASPALDILLDLYINFAAERLVSVSSACIGAACPQTTALRWIAYLQEEKLISRARDELDKRRSHLSLTDKGRAIIEAVIGHY